MARAFTYDEFLLFVEERTSFRNATEKDLIIWYTFYMHGRSSVRWDSDRESNLPDKYKAKLLKAYRERILSSGCTKN